MILGLALFPSAGSKGQTREAIFPLILHILMGELALMFSGPQGQLTFDSNNSASPSVLPRWGAEPAFFYAAVSEAGLVLPISWPWSQH